MDQTSSKSKHQEADVAKSWTDYQRQAARQQSTFLCGECPDKKAFTRQADLERHFRNIHSKEVAEIGLEGLKERSRRQSAIIPIEKDSTTTTSTRVDVTAGKASSKGDDKSRQNLHSRQSSTAISTHDGGLTSDKLHAFSPTSSSRKKKAIGSGTSKSPTASVRTGSDRNDYDRSVAYVSSPSKRLNSSFESYEKRPQVRSTGKRLFDPSDSPSFGRNAPGNSPRQQHTVQIQYSQNVTTQSPTSKSHTTLPTNHERSIIPISVTESRPADESSQSDTTEPKFVLQPETRPISQAQLVAEVKGIYAGLVMVEGKCIQVDQKQAQLAREAPPGTQLTLSNEQWQALIALHRTLLHEHHDFFLASQHPSATPAVRKLALKYAMPARLWRHGIHSFLELLRNRLPDSIDHMLAFIYLSYSMMTLLYETVPAFEGTWIECLGDLGRYRMAIEDDDLRDRETWTQVARQWYLKASDCQPNVGRLYHHLAILARPYPFQQLYYYSKALSSVEPFPATKESILTLFEPILQNKQTRRFPPVITAFIKTHAITFLHTNPDDFSPACEEFLSLLDPYIGRMTQKYLEQGSYVSISTIIAVLSFGSSENLLLKALSRSNSDSTDVEMGNTGEDTLMFRQSLYLFNQSTKIVLHRAGDPNIRSHLYILMVFLKHMSKSAEAMSLLEEGFPKEELVIMLNTLIRNYRTYDRIEQESRPTPEKGGFRPTPDEQAMRGLFWAQESFPTDYFDNMTVEDDDQNKEEPSMNEHHRPEITLWHSVQFSRTCNWIGYNSQEKIFFIPNEDLVDTPTDDKSRSTTATIMGDMDSEPMSPASITTSRRTTFTAFEGASRTNTFESEATDASSVADTAMASKGGGIQGAQSMEVEMDQKDDPGKI